MLRELRKGGFTLKTWTSAFDKVEKEKNVSGTVLGIYYQPYNDSWSIKCRVNFSRKTRNLRPSEDELHNRSELRDFIQKNGLKKINCLQALHQIFDVLNLCLPVRANLALLGFYS